MSDGHLLAHLSAQRGIAQSGLAFLPGIRRTTIQGLRRGSTGIRCFRQLASLDKQPLPGLFLGHGLGIAHRPRNFVV